MNRERSKPILRLDDLPRAPLCEIPWLGNCLVLSDGRVNYCCYSDVAIGNINERSFAELWNGETMRRIRQSLIAHTLPSECSTPSCPFFRRDENHFLVPRETPVLAEGPHDAAVKGQLMVTPVAAGLRVDVKIIVVDPPVKLDAYVAVRGEGDPCSFFPLFDDFPIPCRLGLVATGNETTFTAFEGPMPPRLGQGPWEFCLALYASGEKPTASVGCLAATVANVA